MTPLELALLVLAGVGAGLVGSVVGLASLVSYPVLLSVGLPPVTANVTNTVALVASGVGSAASSRPELAGQRGRLVRLAPVFAAGGLAGGVLLVTTPGEVFERVVPFLVGGASVLMLLQPRLRALVRRPAAPDDAAESWLARVGLFAVAVYGGYFGAAAGVIIPVLLGFVLDASVQRLLALKNVLLMVSNLVAAVLFLALGLVDLDAALPLAVGILVGGWVGPMVSRRLPQGVLRAVIGVAGIGLAVRLWVTAG
ncbi:sulfite exporter TauE/SafE family protein [Pseudokineococcus basanitobsidens]|uniref:Probable membrane transporter protein n=1 Tax=Pseudokineococcus basanitobsidens TaxID=1926649 RepID=A0ABU8RJ48_9ACTN